MSTPYVKHTTHTDALDTLGSIIGPNEARDAIHLAVFNAVAGAYLKPGEHVELRDGVAMPVPVGSGVGIVDPFLTKKVEYGQHFWLVVYPRQISSLRHVWEHPAFPASGALLAEVAAVDQARAASEAWLRNFADEVDADYDEMMDVAASHCTEDEYGGEYLIDRSKWDGQTTPDVFWTHFAVVTGKTPHPERGLPGIFSCVC